MNDPQCFVAYYENQAGGGLPGFYRAPVMYGRGIGLMFSKLFLFLSPMLKKGFTVVKLHLKTAARSIASDVIGQTISKITGIERSRRLRYYDFIMESEKAPPWMTRE